MLETKRPKLNMLSESFIDRIVSEALDVLGKTGVLVENDVKGKRCCSRKT